MTLASATSSDFGRFLTQPSVWKWETILFGIRHYSVFKHSDFGIPLYGCCIFLINVFVDTLSFIATNVTMYGVNKLMLNLIYKPCRDNGKFLITRYGL